MNSIVLILVVAIAGCLAAPKPDVILDHDLILKDSYPHHLRYPYSTFDYNDAYPYYRHHAYRHLPYYHHPSYVHPSYVHPAPEPYFEPAAGRFVYPGLAITKEEKKEEIKMKEEKEEFKEEMMKEEEMK